MKNRIIYAAFTVAIFFATSCNAVDDFLGEEPSRTTRQTIQNTGQLDDILNNFHLFCQESANLVCASDDYWVCTEVQDKKYLSNGGYDSRDLEFALWADSCSAPYNWLNVWSQEYGKIYYANLVLSTIDSVEGPDSEKNNLRAEAHFIRAYSYFNLAVAYTLYYDGGNGNEPGVVMKTSPNFEDPAVRGSVKELWDLIDSDLQASLSLDVPIQNPNGPKRCWRATTPTVYAFAARYYLYRGDYAKALEYADASLSEYAEMEDYNTAMYLDGANASAIASYQNETVYFNCPLYTEYFLLTGYGKLASLLEWKDVLYYRTAFLMSEWYNPSPELLSLYELDVPGGDRKNDLRYKYLYPEHYSLRFCKKTIYHPGYVQLSAAEVITGLTTPEVYLIKAEALARTGRTDDALNVINGLRRKRIASAVFEEVVASSAEDAVELILRERRREIPFATRWYDLKRLNANETAYDDVTIHRSFYGYNTAGVLEEDGVREYVLEPGSRHYALPIPEYEINLSERKLQQNRY